MENNVNIKPIAMKCSEEQFNKIKPILEKNNLEITKIDNFSDFPYLINNLGDLLGCISNAVNANKKIYKREVFEEWNEDIFLEYCGIKKEVVIKPIAMKYSQKQFNKIIPILEKNNLEFYINPFNIHHHYLVNNFTNRLGSISNVMETDKNSFGRTVFEKWNEDIFLEYCGIKKEKEIKEEIKPTKKKRIIF